MLPDCHDVFGLIDSIPGHVAYVQQAVHSADVDKGAIAHQAAHGAGVGVAFFHGSKTALGGGARLLLENHAAIDDNIFIGDVKLGDAAVDLLADQCLDLGGIAGAAAAGGHKCAHADIDVQAALDYACDRAHHGEFLGKGFFERRPVARLSHFEAREGVIPLFVAAGHGDWNRIAGLYRVGVVFECRAREHALGLVSNVEKNLVGRHGDDCAL